MRVVVVDRSDPVRSRLVAHLREAGFDLVGQAASLDEAGLLFARIVPDVIVADVVYAGASPLDIVRMLRTKVPGARLFIFSNEIHIRALCVEHGAHAFFDKSKQLDELVAALQIRVPPLDR